MPILLATVGCRRGYEVDRRTNTVNWVTWDEGNGTQRFPVIGADAATFAPFAVPGCRSDDFGRDARKVFLRERKIEWADPNSFRAFGPNFRDDRSVFMWSGSHIVRVDEADPESFVRTADGIWRDAKRVYYGLRGLVPRDIGSFVVLPQPGWARDDQAYYWYGTEVPGADVKTFEIFAADPTFARDATTLYWQGWPVRPCDPALFRPVRLDRPRYEKGKSWTHAGRTDGREWLFRVRDGRRPGIEFVTLPLPADG